MGRLQQQLPGAPASRAMQSVHLGRRSHCYFASAETDGTEQGRFISAPHGSCALRRRMKAILEMVRSKRHRKTILKNAERPRHLTGRSVSCLSTSHLIHQFHDSPASQVIKPDTRSNSKIVSSSSRINYFTNDADAFCG